jgi:hypothetical protein
MAGLVVGVVGRRTSRQSKQSGKTPSERSHWGRVIEDLIVERRAIGATPR